MKRDLLIILNLISMPLSYHLLESSHPVARQTRTYFPTHFAIDNQLDNLHEMTVTTTTEPEIRGIIQQAERTRQEIEALNDTTMKKLSLTRKLKKILQEASTIEQWLRKPLPQQVEILELEYEDALTIIELLTCGKKARMLQKKLQQSSQFSSHTHNALMAKLERIYTNGTEQKIDEEDTSELFLSSDEKDGFSPYILYRTPAIAIEAERRRPQKIATEHTLKTHTSFVPAQDRALEVLNKRFDQLTHRANKKSTAATITTPVVLIK